MTRLILSFVLVALLMTACQKEDTIFNTDLALDSRFIILNAPADTTKIVVYSDHDWIMTNRDNASWITIQKGVGSGTDYAIVSVPDNSADYPRAATLVFTSGSKTDTLKLGQRGLITPSLSITAAAIAAPAAGGVLQTAITTTLPLSAMEVGYSYEAGSDLITGIQIADGKLAFAVAANEMTATRSAKIFLNYRDVLGANLRDSLVVNQPMP